VYLTFPFLPADSILILAGQDSTEDFDAIHSKKAHKMLERFYIGDVIPDINVLKPDKQEAGMATEVKFALNPKKKIAFALMEKEQLSHDSFLLTYALQTPETVLGLPTGKHIFLSAHIADELTPASKKSLVMRR
jgi:nitrate reductase (NAD(P)H)